MSQIKPKWSFRQGITVLWTAVLFIFWGIPVLSAPANNLVEQFRGQNPWRHDKILISKLVSQERWQKNVCVTLHSEKSSLLKLRLANPPGNLTMTGLYHTAPMNIEHFSDHPGHKDEDSPFHFDYFRNYWYSIGIHPDLDRPYLSRPASVTIKGQLGDSTGVDSRTSYVDPKANGGLGYIGLRDDIESADTDYTLCYSTIGVKAPWFKLGRDSAEKWDSEIRQYPGLWAELQGERSILTLPSDMLRDQREDPTPIINAYDTVVKRAEHFIGLSPYSHDPRHRSPTLPFRFVMDVNTADNDRSHAGDPTILYWLESGNPGNFINPDFVIKDRTITRLAVMNLTPAHSLVLPPGSALAMADVTGMIQIHGWKSFKDKLSQFDFSITQNWSLHSVFSWDYYQNGFWSDDIHSNYEWKLGFMTELAISIPEKTFTKFYKYYRMIPEDQLPGNRQEGTDFFFKNICLLADRDMSSLFRKWNVPVSEYAYSDIAEMGLPGHVPRREEL